eukprot:c20361_g1_i2 orf=1032-2261(+)
MGQGQFLGSSCFLRAWFFINVMVLSRSALAQSCSKSLQFQNGDRKSFASCVDLSVQGAKLAWSLDPVNNTLSVAFSGSAPSSSGWVGWGLNPTKPQMVGTSSFIAFSTSNGTHLLPYNLTAATQQGSPLITGPIDYTVLEKDVEISGLNVSIYVKLILPSNQTLLNHVWNRGSSVVNFEPQPHSLSQNDLLGAKQIDMSSGAVTSSGNSHQHLKNRHGVINAVAWGILLPLGVMSARYMRPFSDAAWFYAHISFQCTGYTLGVAGWATGLKLGSYSEGVVHHKHRSVGITLFALATLQVMALLLRPKKEHKIRKYWNIYHHTIGYSLILLGILNIFFGFDLLVPQKKWRHAYYGVLGSLGGITLVLEIATWIIYFRSDKEPSGKPYGETIYSAGGVANGHDTRRSNADV